MVLLVYFILLLLLFVILNRTIKSVSLFLILIQILSLSGALYVGLDYQIDTVFKWFNVFLTGLILTLIISPWRKFNKIQNITFRNELKLKKLTDVLLFISLFTFITLLATVIFVFLLVEDINNFRYGIGVSTKFYYSLPINIKAIILANYLYYLSYFLIPLHFYYLGKRNFKMSVFCFIGSLNIVLFGLTFFSRAIFVQYSLMYIAFLFLLYDTLDIQIKRYIKIAIIVIGVFFSIYFINLTKERFVGDHLYEKTISQKSRIQDPVVYSYFDYLSQWYHNSMYVLNTYDFKTFKSQATFQPIISLLAQYNFIKYSAKDYAKLRKSLWPHHWDKFNGLVAYMIYDYGYTISILVSLIYYSIVRRLKPKKREISIINLFYLILLIQIPLLAIFYSFLGGIIIPGLLLIPIHIYLRTTMKYQNPTVQHEVL